MILSTPSLVRSGTSRNRLGIGMLGLVVPTLCSAGAQLHPTINRPRSSRCCQQCEHEWESS